MNKHTFNKKNQKTIIIKIITNKSNLLLNDENDIGSK